MYSIMIGELLDPEVRFYPEGCHYQFDSSGHTLTLLLSDPSELEIDCVQRQSVEFALFLRKRVVFLLFKFGAMPWSFAPYSYWLVSPENRVLPEPNDPPEFHALLKAIMVDSATGTVKALRACTFSAPFTTLLHQAILEQTEKEWSRSENDAIIRQIYEEYPDTENMLFDSVLMCRGGE